MEDATKGRIQKAESKAKISASLKSYWSRVPERRARFSDANKEMWTKPEYRMKMSLKGDKNPSYKSGHYQCRGYHFVLKPEHPNADKNGYVPEHRFVMAEKLGRPLIKGEDVHHLNGDRGDNRPENLVLMTKSGHTKLSPWCGRCELRKEIRLLRWQIKELSAALQLKLGEGMR